MNILVRATPMTVNKRFLSLQNTKYQKSDHVTTINVDDLLTCNTCISKLTCIIKSTWNQIDFCSYYSDNVVQR